MSILLFDLPDNRKKLLPFTYVRPISEIRVGILTIGEKWAQHLQQDIQPLTEKYLQGKFGITTSEKSLDLYINGAICPDKQLVETILSLKTGEVLKVKETFIAAKGAISHANIENIQFLLSQFHTIEYPNKITVIERPYQIFQLNGHQIREDYQLITKNRESKKIQDPHTAVYGRNNIFLEEGVTIRASIINAENGPVYLGKNSTVNEGSIIRGPFSLGENSHLNMGAKMRGDITIGPSCKVGGEVSNSVFFGYSNKGHDGYLGNSVIGEWCNLGADTNSSNLKNNYSNIKLWDYASERMEDSKLQFCGLLMGDHSKSGINTMFNTGTTIGISANVFGSGFPPKFIPSFSWGSSDGFTTFDLTKAGEVAKAVMQRRELLFDKSDKSIFNNIFEQSTKYRNWEVKQ